MEVENPQNCRKRKASYRDIAVAKRLRSLKNVTKVPRRETAAVHSDLDMLSAECLLLIFSHLDVKDLCLGANLVCKVWSDIAIENMLWKKLVSVRWHMDSKPVRFDSWKEFYLHQETKKRERNEKLKKLFNSMSKKEFLITNKYITKNNPFYTAGFDTKGIDVCDQADGKLHSKISYFYDQGFPIDGITFRRIGNKLLQKKILEISRDLASEKAQVFIPINCIKCSDRLLTMNTFYFCTNCSASEPFVLCEGCQPKHEHEHPLRRIENLPRL